MTIKPTAYIIFCFLFLLSCDPKKANNSTGSGEEQTGETDDWYSLMSLDEWHVYNTDTVNEGWVLENGELYFNPASGSRGDLVTNRSFEDFELSLEWKIDSCGNSGIMWGVVESPDLSSPYLSGPEMQILDDACHADGNIEKHRAGDLYDMIACSQTAVNPVGDWNLVSIKSKDGYVVFHLNGIKVVEFQMYGEAWSELVANSKFKDWTEFGKHKNGKIALQDHSDPVWFRDVKIREL